LKALDMKSSLLALAAALALLVGAPASALTLNASASAGVTNEPGTDGIVRYNGYITVNWGDGWENVGLIQFDLAGVSGLSSAVLNLYHEYNSGVNAEFAVFRNTSAWVGNTNNWLTRPTYDATPAGTLSLVAGSYGQYEWYAIDVTATVAAWADGTHANYGFTLARTDAANPFLYFQGKGQANPPTLLLSAVPEPSTYGLMFGGLALLGCKLRRRSA